MQFMQPRSLDFALRHASSKDFHFCWSLHRDAMKPLTTGYLEWNESGQKRVVEGALADRGTSIIVVNGSDAGWLRVDETRDELYLGHLYILPAMRNRGIGTTVVQQLSDRARREGKVLTLEVMTNNRARFLYERLGFHIIDTSKYKLKMQFYENA
jgi:ribosomal protein S18 acetylase RimI-like enzyme